jgi:hypothetical protein
MLRVKISHIHNYVRRQSCPPIRVHLAKVQIYSGMTATFGDPVFSQGLDLDEVAEQCTPRQNLLPWSRPQCKILLQGCSFDFQRICSLM